MGSCFSTDDAAGAADAPPTAKVITLAGALREHSPHVTASQVLAGGHAPCFLCSSDKLFCNDYVTPLDPQEPLQPGHLYFVLPAAKLPHPLSGDDMAELVVRATSALASGKGSKKEEKKKQVGGGRLEELEGFDEKEGLVRPSVRPGKRTMRRSGSMQRRVAHYRYRSSTGARLTTIAEGVE